MNSFFSKLLILLCFALVAGCSDWDQPLHLTPDEGTDADTELTETEDSQTSEEDEKRNGIISSFVDSCKAAKLLTDPIFFSLIKAAGEKTGEEDSCQKTAEWIYAAEEIIDLSPYDGDFTARTLNLNPLVIFPKIKGLKLKLNGIEKITPSELEKLKNSSITELGLEKVGFQQVESIPDWFPKLIFLDLSNNDLTDDFQDQISTLEVLGALKTLDLSGNALGRSPDYLPRNLEKLILKDMGAFNERKKLSELLNHAGHCPTLKEIQITLELLNPAETTGLNDEQIRTKTEKTVKEVEEALMNKPFRDRKVSLKKKNPDDKDDKVWIIELGNKE